jgi:feruloyl esterase
MDPDLEVFKKRGGKLIMYHGYADPFVTPMSSIAYYNRVTGEEHPGRHKGNDGNNAGGQNNDGNNAAGQNRTVDFARLFMVPGMWHCAGGPGPSNFDVFTPLTQWVEHGVTPDRIIGTHTANTAGPIPFTRPLCPFPKEAVYDGDGDKTDAANFVCKVVK